MALNVFDNDGGVGDNTWEAAINWSLGVIPVNGDYVQISEDCTLNSDQSAVVLSGGISQIDVGVTLTIGSSGVMYVQNTDLKLVGIATSGWGGSHIVFSGGTLRITATTTSTRALEVNGGCTITCDANGGTIELNCTASSNDAQIEARGTIFAWRKIAGHASSRLVIDGTVGTYQTRVTNLSGLALWERVDFDEVTVYGDDESFIMLDDCLVHDVSDGLFAWAGGGIVVDSWIYGCTRGVYNVWGTTFQNVVFGKQEGGTLDENTSGDIVMLKATQTIAWFFNCLFASTIDFDITATTSKHARYFVVSEKHNQTAGDWLRLSGPGECIIENEDGAGAQGGSGRAVKVTTSSDGVEDAASLPLLHMNLPIAVLPADQSDSVTIKIYVKGTNLTTCTVHVDPYSIFGTTQKFNVTCDGNWNQITLPAYTVSIAAGLSGGIPIAVDCDDNNEVYYFDTVTV